mmetsp:Transcript_8957/g.21838  ORF Transcript_8957/g.21838 Transcript_8957/m.21838 type:complete len:291 (-) Transcript_8957:3026-3898(-)
MAVLLHGGHAPRLRKGAVLIHRDRELEVDLLAALQTKLVPLLVEQPQLVRSELARVEVLGLDCAEKSLLTLLRDVGGSKNVHLPETVAAEHRFGVVVSEHHRVVRRDSVHRTGDQTRASVGLQLFWTHLKLGSVAEEDVHLGVLLQRVVVLRHDHLGHDVRLLHHHLEDLIRIRVLPSDHGRVLRDQAALRPVLGLDHHQPGLGGGHVVTRVRVLLGHSGDGFQGVLDLRAVVGEHAALLLENRAEIALDTASAFRQLLVGRRCLPVRAVAGLARGRKQGNVDAADSAPI